MVSVKAFIQIFVGIIGFFSTLGMFWVGKAYNWNDEVNMVTALMMAVGTILIELSVSFNGLQNSIEKLYPVLELSAEEQRNIHQSILLNNELQQHRGEPHAEIALWMNTEIVELLKDASEGNDFFTDNIFQANLLSLQCMRPGQTFKGLSALINPHYWEHDSDMEEYKRINFEQAKIGVIIQRIFLFTNEAEYDQMISIMQEQYDNKIHVFYCFRKEINDINHFPDFTSIKDLNFAIIVPREERLQTVTLTRNKHSIAEVESQFAKILQRSKKFDGIK